MADDHVVSEGADGRVGHGFDHGSVNHGENRIMGDPGLFFTGKLLTGLTEGKLHGGCLAHFRLSYRCNVASLV